MLAPGRTSVRTTAVAMLWRCAVAFCSNLGFCTLLNHPYMYWIHWLLGDEMFSVGSVVWCDSWRNWYLLTCIKMSWNEMISITILNRWKGHQDLIQDVWLRALLFSRVCDHVIVTRVRVTCTGKLNGSAAWRLVVIAGCGVVIITVSKVVPSAHRSRHHLSRHYEHVLILLVLPRFAVVHECIGIMHSVIFVDDFPIILSSGYSTLYQSTESTIDSLCHSLSAPFAYQRHVVRAGAPSSLRR